VVARDQTRPNNHEHGVVILDDLTRFLHDFMGDAGDKDPYMPHGLQLRGREEVQLVAVGITTSSRVFSRFARVTNSRRGWPLCPLEPFTRALVPHRTLDDHDAVAMGPA
jgi:hypothetical protein